MSPKLHVKRRCKMETRNARYTTPVKPVRLNANPLFKYKTLFTLYLTHYRTYCRIKMYQGLGVGVKKSVKYHLIKKKPIGR